MARWGAALLLATGITAGSGRAGAYCWQRACDTVPSYDDVWQNTPDPACIRDDFECLLEGTHLHWPATCISYGVQKDGSIDDGIDFELATSLVDDAFATWQAADCSGAPPSLIVKNFGPITCARREYSQSQPNANVFMFRDGDWPYEASAGTALAFTWITYNTETAEIYNADIEINSFELTLTVTDESVATDLRSILRHEVGHFLGLGHSGDRQATMWSEYAPRTIEQRSLAPDDEAGICAIYPPGRKVGGSCEPRHGFSRECAKEETGCSMARASGGGAGGWLSLGFGAWLARRARSGLSSKRRAPRR